MPIHYPVRFSTPQGHKKIIRKTYSRLRHAQANNVPLTNPTIHEIKFYLKTNNRCRKVSIDNDNTISLSTPVVSLDNFSRFITSQLEAQKITDNYRQSVQLATVLVLLSRHFVANPSQTASIPTLFSWHETDRRRTLYLFAYLDHPMEARTYSAAELLGLRQSQVSETSDGLLARLKTDPEFGEVVSKDKANATQAPTRAPKKAKGISSSSNESDEVVYRGKNIPRQPSQPGQPSSNLQWKYRGRTGSEIASSEPLPAPTGLDKQSSEGFQRFFKAVVSPTHVRVTAGGRIVPNTRNSVSPTTKWDKERLPVDVQNSGESANEPKVNPIFASTNNQVPPPMYHQPQPILYQPMSVPIPFYHPMQTPVQHGFAYPYGFAPLAAPVSHTPYLPLPKGEQRAQAVGGGGRQNGGENDNRSRRAPITISPPEQFDQNRPFYVNGQLVFPPAGMGPSPMHQMVPNHYYTSGVMTAAAPPDRHTATANHPISNMPMSAGTDIPHRQQYLGAPDRNSAPQHLLAPVGQPSGTMPPFSSIRPSEITKKQLEGLRHSLKYYIGQLQFNRHQIDEPWVFAQAQKVRENIKQFEHNLQMQMQFEMEHYPDMEPTPKHISELVMPCNTPSRPPSIRHTQASGSSHHGSIRSIGPHPGSKHFQSQQVGMGYRMYSKPNRAAVGINSNRTDNSTGHIDALEAAVIKRLSAPDATPEQKVMLEAITRPLNPKYDSKLPVAQESSSDNRSSKDYSAQVGPAGEKKRMEGQANLPGAYLQHQQGGREIAQPGGIYGTNGNPPYIAPANRNGLTVPYLIGNYPPGTDPWTYQGHEFVYARELTHVEKQARNVYWGKLPSKETGLPKFDGKDFYPASPQKATADKVRIQSRTSGQPEIDSGFELRRSEIDPFRSSRDANSIRSYESGRKFSKAIPIVAPPDVDKKSTAKISTMSKAKANENNTEELNKLSHALLACKLSSPDESSTKYLEKRKSPPLSRRAVERSSVRSGHDLWQTMLKKGSTSGNALPGAVSSTTATGYLPQYAGNAIASLGPTISNGSPARVSPTADDKLIELEGPRVAVKMGENCPPSSAPSMEHDITKDLHQRMLRDAERRGVIGSDWQ